MSRDKHDEDEILKSFDDGEWQSVDDPHRRIDLKEYARATLLKDKRITLRLSSGDLMAIQSMKEFHIKHSSRVSYTSTSRGGLWISGIREARTGLQA
jgi:predicted DNA binding CopG/RHH family protein